MAPRDVAPQPCAHPTHSTASAPSESLNRAASSEQPADLSAAEDLSLGSDLPLGLTIDLRIDDSMQCAGELFSQSASLMQRLRGPHGCPWDREQTPETIRRYTLEETYEVLDAIERKHSNDLCEELGDLLLQVLFYAQMASESVDEAERFTIADVVQGLNRKLIRRHPHVFGEAASLAAGNTAVALPTPAANFPVAPIDTTGVLRNWEQIKQAEKFSRSQSARPGAQHGSSGPHEPMDRMAGVLRSQPALLEAHKLGAAAAKCGFDWTDPQGLLAKIREEADEVEVEMTALTAMRSDPAAAGPQATAWRESLERNLQMEVGDLLFVTASLARHLKVDAETALRDANAKFRSRFAAMEAIEATEATDAGTPTNAQEVMESTGTTSVAQAVAQSAQQKAARPLEERSLEELESLWQQAKQREAVLKAAAPAIHLRGQRESTS
jgi:uncharacterized protein YabN with tetrapyrrole methylase and pyrophosphatase domain